jgi:branched-chain amino acid transport system substrate-binding protein
MRRSARALAVLAVLGLVAAACGDDEGETTTTGATGATSATGATAPVEKIDVTVYAQGAWTGPYNYLVLPGIQAAQLHAKELSEDPTYPANITIGTADTQGSGDQAPPVVQNVISDPNTVAVVGPAFSGESLASGDSYEQAGIPFVTQSATLPDLATQGWTFWYRTVAGDVLQGGSDGRFLAEVVGSTKLFVVNDKEAYGKGLADQVIKAATESGAEIVGNEGVAPTDDYSALISGIESSGADAVFYGGYDADFAKIVKQGTDAGLSVKWMSGDGSVSSTYIDNAGPGAEGSYLSIASSMDPSFIDKYNAAYGSEAAAVPVYAAEGYDVMGLIGEGIRQAIEGGATTPEEIRAGIKAYLDTVTVDAPYQGVAKEIAFDANHDLTAADPLTLMFFYQVTNGAIAPLGDAASVLGG